MPIIITNIGGNLLGVCKYELRINTRPIATFEHNRPDGLSACLSHAAAAAEKAKWEGMAEELIDINKTQEAEEIYKMYPSRRADGQPTGKSRRHKEKIAKLLKQGTPLKEILTLYLKAKDPRYIPNLGTFLNNLPDIEELREPDAYAKMPRL